MTDTGNPSAPAQSAHARAASSRRRANAVMLAPDARNRLAQLRRRVRAAARRGDTEVVVAGVSTIAQALCAEGFTVTPVASTIAQALCAEGFTVTPVASEDGPYAVVAW